MPSDDKEVDRVKPELEASAAILEDRPRARIDVMAAARARIRLPLRKPVERDPDRGVEEQCPLDGLRDRKVV